MDIYSKDMPGTDADADMDANNLEDEGWQTDFSAMEIGANHATMSEETVMTGAPAWAIEMNDNINAMNANMSRHVRYMETRQQEWDEDEGCTEGYESEEEGEDSRFTAPPESALDAEGVPLSGGCAPPAWAVHMNKQINAINTHLSGISHKGRSAEAFRINSSASYSSLKQFWMIHDKNGNNPPHFYPKDRHALHALSDPQVTELLQFYGLEIHGQKHNRLIRLMGHLGIVFA